MGREQPPPTGDRPAIYQTDTMGDIRFAFSIWHQPIIKTEGRVQRNDAGARARITSRPGRTTEPFTWLPLLPIETSVEGDRTGEGSVVTTGFPLVSPMKDNSHIPAIPNLIRRASAAVIDVERENSSARKKQRMTSEEPDLEDVELSIDQQHVVPAVIFKGNEVLETRIKRVRMRDVDLVEDFLVNNTLRIANAERHTDNSHDRRTNSCQSLEPAYHCEFSSALPAYPHWPYRLPHAIKNRNKTLTRLPPPTRSTRPYRYWR